MKNHLMLILVGWLLLNMGYQVGIRQANAHWRQVINDLPAELAKLGVVRTR